MKKLIDLPVVDVLDALIRIPVPVPITMKDAMYYFVFMEMMARRLEENGNDPNLIDLEYIHEIAKSHGGMVEHDLSELHDGALIRAMLHNSEQDVLYTRLTYLTSRLLTD